MTVHRLLYRSDIGLIGTVADVQQHVGEIVRLSEARNAAVGLTGALLLTRGVFIQALEGPLPAIEATFERICCDLRHRRVELLDLAQAESRVFAKWSMAQISADRKVERLLSCLPHPVEQGLESTSAQATIQFMLALLMSGPVSDQSSEGIMANLQLNR